MRHRRSFILVALLAVFITASGFQDSPPYKVLFEKAKYTMETKGDLNGAIDLFNEIIKEYPDQREYAAKSQLYIGLCYEKMGLEEAQKAYRKVVDNYPEQQQEVAMARENLNRLLALRDVPRKPTFRKIQIPTKLSWSVRLSPDGKALGLVSDEKIFIMPISGNISPDIPGAPVQLNTEDIDVEYTDLSWSQDGKWIAFNEVPIKDGNQSIYIVPSKGGKPEKIIKNYRDAHIVNYRISLSPDGKNLAFSSVENNKQHIYSIPVEGGNPIQLTSMEAREPVYSPDGKLLAFVEDKDLGAGQGGLGLWVIPSKGGAPQLVADAGTAASPVWSPDGRMLAFLDASEGKKQIIIVSVPRNNRTKIKKTSIDIPEGIGGVRMLAGWTPDNKIGAICETKMEFAIYTLPAKGGQATMVLHDCYALQPRWTPDGKQIIYTTTPQEGDNRFFRLFLSSVPANGGNGTPLPKDQKENPIHMKTNQGGNRVSPDGKWIILSAWTTADSCSNINYAKMKIWKMAVDGSESRQITYTQGLYADLCPSWSPDGEKVAFVQVKLQEGLDPFGDRIEFYIVNATGGEPDLLHTVSGKYVSSPIWSPDGKMIAYLTGDKPTRSNPTMNVIYVNTGKSRVIGKVPKAHVNIELAWSPDSKRIAFNGEQIHVMDIEDGSIKDIETNLTSDVEIWHLDWSPDGEQFVFAAGKGGNDEFWLLEDFLSELK